MGQVPGRFWGRFQEGSGAGSGKVPGQVPGRFRGRFREGSRAGSWKVLGQVPGRFRGRFREGFGAGSGKVLGQVPGRFRGRFREGSRAGSGKVPGQVPNHGFREGSGAGSERQVPGRFRVSFSNDGFQVPGTAGSGKVPVQFGVRRNLNCLFALDKFAFAWLEHGSMNTSW